eukprot:scaffold226447_cov19-Tisochrysis_lutea.AAC.2
MGEGCNGLGYSGWMQVGGGCEVYGYSWWMQVVGAIALGWVRSQMQVFKGSLNPYPLGASAVVVPVRFQHLRTYDKMAVKPCLPVCWLCAGQTGAGGTDGPGAARAHSE